MAPLPPHPPLQAYYHGSKRSFVRRIFDEGASDYDRIERIMALGTGSWYRRRALARAGLSSGMKVLDVAIGTGLVAREAIALTGSERNVIGLDPSTGMLAEARRNLTVRVIQATGEHLPLAGGSFDFISMGYALRHLSDLAGALREFRRVLRPGGRLCILELTRPPGRVAMSLLRGYMRYLIPRLSRLKGGQADALLWRYYWDTIEACVPPECVLGALAEAGFQQVGRHVELKIFSEYTASA